LIDDRNGIFQNDNAKQEWKEKNRDEKYAEQRVNK
jgi:hypothetical protein